MVINVLYIPNYVGYLQDRNPLPAIRSKFVNAYLNFYCIIISMPMNFVQIVPINSICLPGAVSLIIMERDIRKSCYLEELGCTAHIDPLASHPCRFHGSACFSVLTSYD